MQYDRQIKIATGASRKATVWKTQSMLLSELYTRLALPARGTETRRNYLSLKKARQDELKDVGGFVAGSLEGSRRKGRAVTGRDLLTLDLDNIPAGGTDTVLRRLEALGCGYCVYSTRKHGPEAPRLRVLFPMDRSCTADEYEPLARRMAEYVGIDMADPSTFEASRLMYWPSCCSDGDYVYHWADKPMLSAEELLGTYPDWKDVSSWPQVPGMESAHIRLASKQGDPEEKSGVVGAFCRSYDVLSAMESFLPGVYTPVENLPGRYTYSGGSTTGGAVLYDNEKFLFSHHATDPCGGRLVNAFDLVRLHKFGELDDDADAKLPTNRLPSYTAMKALAAKDTAVRQLLGQERQKEIAEAFGGDVLDEDGAWMEQLATHSTTGLPLATMDNIWRILEYDPNLKGKFALNRFAGRGEVLGALPWQKDTDRRFWEDNDNYGLYWYLEKYYKISGNGKTDGALSLHSNKHSFNDVTDYITSLTWDGVPRLDTLLIDYLGAEDCPYTRAVTRKAFVAAVARAMSPGTKFDCMTILSGPQGIGKSTLIHTMSRGWYNDGIRSFEGKDASELLQGVWLVEIAELQAFRNSDIDRIKQFVSQRADRFRAAYGRHVRDMPRRCVFFGTTNSREFLRDRTGNRRFWPVDVGVQATTKNVFKDLADECDQLWAEAVVYWKRGEPLILSRALEEEAKQIQEDHREASPREGIIRAFVERPVPKNWNRWSRSERMAYWNGGFKGEAELAPRDRVCALEIWCEALDGDPRHLRYSESQEINDSIANMEGWERAKSVLKYGPYGAQRGFRKTGL